MGIVRGHPSGLALPSPPGGSSWPLGKQSPDIVPPLQMFPVTLARNRTAASNLLESDAPLKTTLCSPNSAPVPKETVRTSCWPPPSSAAGRGPVPSSRSIDPAQPEPTPRLQTTDIPTAARPPQPRNSAGVPQTDADSPERDNAAHTHSTVASLLGRSPASAPPAQHPAPSRPTPPRGSSPHRSQPSAGSPARASSSAASASLPVRASPKPSRTSRPCSVPLASPIADARRLSGLARGEAGRRTPAPFRGSARFLRR